MTDTDRDAVERTARGVEHYSGQVPRQRAADLLRALLDAKEGAEAKLRHFKKEVVDTLEANEADALAAAEEAWEAQKKAEAEVAALREKLRDKIKHLHARLPYFNVPHIREELEDMLDVIGPMEGDEDDG